VFFLKMSRNLHKSFAAMTHLAQGLCLTAFLMVKVKKLPYSPCWHTNINSVHDEKVVDSDPGNVSKK
jgi:hypothetical protein